MYLCHCLLPAPASLYHETSSRLHTISMKVTLERAQARPKDGTKRSSWETVISPAKLPLVMESRPLPGHHIRNSYWSKPSCWVQNKHKYRAKRFICHAQTDTYYHCCVEHPSELFLCMVRSTKLATRYFLHMLYLPIYSSFLLEPRDTKIYILN